MTQLIEINAKDNENFDSQLHNTLLLYELRDAFIKGGMGKVTKTYSKLVLGNESMGKLVDLSISLKGAEHIIEDKLSQLVSEKSIFYELNKNINEKRERVDDLTYRRNIAIIKYEAENGNLTTKDIQYYMQKATELDFYSACPCGSGRELITCHYKLKSKTELTRPVTL